MTAKSKRIPAPSATPALPVRISDKEPPSITKGELRQLQQEHATKSALIRALAAKGLPTNAIAHTLLHYDILSPRSAYQHVRNVLKTPLKRQNKNRNGNGNGNGND